MPLDTIRKSPEIDAGGNPSMETDSHPTTQRSRGRRRRYSVGEAWGYIAAAFAACDDECIDWPWARDVHEYPVLCVDSVKYLVHRLTCALQHGEPPEGAMATHKCGRPCCINPNHLRWGDACRNAIDQHTHGTSRSKLTKEQVLKARKIKASQVATFAELCGVRPAIVACARMGRTWGHLAGGDQQVRYEKRQKARADREKNLAALSPSARSWHARYM